MSARRIALLALVLAPACAGAPPTAARVAAAPPAPTFDPAWLVGGVWNARESDTPLGPIPFQFEFRREPDGSVHAHTGDDARYVDLRFRRGPGGWALDERAALPGVGTQAYTLTPRPSGAPDEQVWDLDGKPDFLAVRVTRHTDDQMTFAVLLRGAPHVRFELARSRAGTAAASMER